MNLVNKLRQIFAGDQEVLPEIIEDLYATEATQRELVAMELLDEEIYTISSSNKVSRREAFCKLMAIDGVNCKERKEVESFFWTKGVSEENVQALTDEFYRLQELKFKGE